MTRCGAHLILSCDGFGVVLRHQGKDRLPFIRNLPPHDRGHGSLAVEIDHKHLIAVQSRGHRQVGSGRGLSYPSLKIRH